MAGSDTPRGAAIFQAECAKCHGTDGLGGKAGEYPRLAGLPAGYLKQQLEAFRDRKRQNKPMIPVLKAGRLRGDDIAAVAAHLAGLPPPDPEQVGVPTEHDYDRELGEGLYVAGCSLCHGLDGNGKPDTDNPPVTRQYPAYLIKQMRDFRAGRRWHEQAEELFVEAEPEELDALIAYMLELNHRPASPAEPAAPPKLPQD
ncbi:MAG: c-type cytochrome [Bdellovibrio bacteriovorus]